MAKTAKKKDKEAKPQEEKEDPIKLLEQQLAAEKEKFLRLFAEFENYKKRTTKERIELFKTAGQELMTAMLPVADDFQRAMVELQKSEEKALVDGVSLIQNKFIETLKNNGLHVVEVKKGDLFDADQHEAITQIPAPEEHLKGAIIDVVEVGYKLGEKIIRYPKVVVGH